MIRGGKLGATLASKGLALRKALASLVVDSEFSLRIGVEVIRGSWRDRGPRPRPRLGGFEVSVGGLRRTHFKT